ncbi:MAG TPA: hypothetical protein VD735_07850 [Candidatus Saccharimonadales bacterium]|nr:hypothetical protein [Candidatus Saccharimonadales bacterium]
MSLQRFEAYMAAYGGHETEEAPLRLHPAMTPHLVACGSLAVATTEQERYVGVWSLKELQLEDERVAARTPAIHVVMGDSRPESGIVIARHNGLRRPLVRELLIPGAFEDECLAVTRSGKLRLGGLAMQPYARKEYR